MRKFLTLLALCYATFAYAEVPIFEEADEKEARILRQDETSLFFWHRFKANFGMEKVYLRFPHAPTEGRSNTLLIAYAYESNVMYSFSGYYPPMGNINPHALFDRTLLEVSSPPLLLIDHTVYQMSSGDWVLDYVTHDTYKNVRVKSRTIVTPFNAYTLQCVLPHGAYDNYDYFLDSFSISCECCN